MRRATARSGDAAAATTGEHICVFHDGAADLQRLLGDLVLPATTRDREAIFLYGAPGTAAGLLRDLEAVAGRSLAEEVAAGRILLAESDRDASVHLDRLIAGFDAPAAAGYERVRALAKVEWDHPAFPAPEDFLWAESRLTGILAGRPVLLLCAYDLATLPGAALVYGGLETHRKTLEDERLVANPAFVPADRYMRERLLRLPWLQ